MDRDRKLTDTGKQRAIAREEAEGVVQRAMGARREETPVTSVRSGDSNDHLRVWIAEHQNDCFNSGPGAKLWDKLDEVEKEVAMIKNEQAETRGAAREAGRAAGVRSALITSVIVVAAQVGLFLAARAWPATQAQAAPVHQVGQP